MGFCGGCFKALLIFFNIIFWLSGAAILGVGVWMIVDKNINSYFEVLNVDTHDQYFKYAAYMLIAFGVFVFLVGFFGCCGAIRGSKCLLGLVEKKVDDTLTKSIKEKYNISTTITEAWNVVQIQKIPPTCCVLTNKNEAEEKPDSAKAKNLTACMELKDTMFFHQKTDCNENQTFCSENQMDCNENQTFSSESQMDCNESQTIKVSILILR
ncbi:CD9-like protein [Mya arenaria]|uniref:CD9-like protein n=1 Tax=Mya arenaria TaxID=6604 RepID=A0ABY7DWZ2_MYAAR|nr:CD9-like protein [Mya arenaria]